MGLRARIERLEQATEGERTALVCPECGEKFTLHGDPVIEFMAYEWAKGYEGKLYGPPTDPAVVNMAQHEHDANEFIDIATGEWWLKELFGAERRETANGA